MHGADIGARATDMSKSERMDVPTASKVVSCNFVGMHAACMINGGYDHQGC